MNTQQGLDYLYKVGKDVLGEGHEKVERKAVEVAGLMGCMGTMYAEDNKIKCDSVSINFKDLSVHYLLKDGSLVNVLKIEIGDIQNPTAWIEKNIKNRK